MALLVNPDRALRELLSAAAVDPALRRRLKASALAVLADWGIRAPGRTVYFVEPGEVPPEGRDGEAFVELPQLSPSLGDDDLDAVAGGWDEARDRAVKAVDHAVQTVDWRQADAWKRTDPWAF